MVEAARQIKKIKSADAPLASEAFGRAIAKAGEHILVGAHHNDDNGRDAGCVYVFYDRTGRQIAKLKPDDGASRDYFGASIATSDRFALIGAPRSRVGGVDSGSAYLFDINKNKQVMKLAPNDGVTGMRFGGAVALSDQYALVGAPGRNGRPGSAYLFEVDTGRQIVKLSPDKEEGMDLFGSSVALAGNVGRGGGSVGRCQWVVFGKRLSI